MNNLDELQLLSLFLVMSHNSIRGCVRLLVSRLVCWMVSAVSAGRDEPANDLFCVYKLVQRYFCDIDLRELILP